MLVRRRRGCLVQATIFRNNLERLIAAAADILALFGHISVTLVVFAPRVGRLRRVIIAIVTVVLMMLIRRVLFLFGIIIIFRVHLWEVRGLSRLKFGRVEHFTRVLLKGQPASFAARAISLGLVG